jgi:hypothetical protein
MSNIDNLNHSVVAFDPKKSKAFTGQRLSKVSYKTISDKTNPLYGVKRESKCVSIPIISSEEVRNNITLLMPHIVEFVAGVQDKIIRESVDNGALNISMESISMASCLEYLDNNNESGRLTKESVGIWFNEVIQDNLAMALMEKLGVSEVPTAQESAQVMKVIEQFRDKVSGLAGGKTSYEPKLCESLKKCLVLAPEGDSLAMRFIGRLDTMIEKAKGTVDLADLL